MTTSSRSPADRRISWSGFVASSGSVAVDARRDDVDDPRADQAVVEQDAVLAGHVVAERRPAPRRCTRRRSGSRTRGRRGRRRGRARTPRRTRSCCVSAQKTARIDLHLLVRRGRRTPGTARRSGNGDSVGDVNVDPRPCRGAAPRTCRAPAGAAPGSRSYGRLPPVSKSSSERNTRSTRGFGLVEEVARTAALPAGTRPGRRRRGRTRCRDRSGRRRRRTRPGRGSRSSRRGRTSRRRRRTTSRSLSPRATCADPRAGEAVGLLLGVDRAQRRVVEHAGAVRRSRARTRAPPPQRR